jgi:hypothetical protein
MDTSDPPGGEKPAADYLATVLKREGIPVEIYGIVAQRRVYGGSWLATGAKAFGVAVLYGTMWSVAVLVVTLWASR